MLSSDGSGPPVPRPDAGSGVEGSRGPSVDGGPASGRGPAHGLSEAAGVPGDEAAGPVVSTSTVRVRYAETDQMGVVYYANYFVWFEVARADLLRSLGWSYREMELAGVLLPVIEAECRYHRGARYDDELDVRAEGRMLSPARMEFTYEVVRRGDATLAASGRTVHAAVRPDGRPCRLPDRIRQAFGAPAAS